VLEPNGRYRNDFSREELARDACLLGLLVNLKVEREWYRLYYGIYPAALSAMSLPQPEPLEQLHRAWLGAIGQRNMTLYNRWKVENDT